MSDLQSLFMSLMSNPKDAKNQIDNFGKNIEGDPKKKVEELINSGQMSQDQYNTLSKMANMLMKMM